MRALSCLSLLALSTPAAATPDLLTVFLQRDGQTVRHEGRAVEIPRFGGGDATWAATVACVRQQFAPFQLEIVDRRPPAGAYITAVVGGNASMLGLDDEVTTGVAPYSGDVQRSATVHVFSRSGAGERDAASLCATTAHEVGHALGLDHTFKCGDVMSYFNDACGPQRFLDATVPCGEAGARTCGNGDETQNSYRRLAALVGLRREEASGDQPAIEAPPAPIGAAPDNHPVIDGLGVDTELDGEDAIEGATDDAFEAGEDGVFEAGEDEGTVADDHARDDEDDGDIDLDLDEEDTDALPDVPPRATGCGPHRARW